MRAAVLYDVDDVRIEQRPLPQLNDGEVLVRTMASGICSGDVMAWYIRRKAPLVLGQRAGRHRFVETRGNAPFAAGDRVFVHHHCLCLECRPCAARCVRTVRGMALQQDRSGRKWRSTFGCRPVNLRDTLVLPDAITLADASLIEPLACVVKSLRRSGLRARRPLLRDRTRRDGAAARSPRRASSAPKSSAATPSPHVAR